MAITDIFGRENILHKCFVLSNQKVGVLISNIVNITQMYGEYIYSDLDDYLDWYTVILVQYQL